MTPASIPKKKKNKVKNMAKTSIHFQTVKGGSEEHNKREKMLDYVFQELTHKNEYWQIDTQENRLAAIKEKYKNSTGQKMQAKATPIREAVVVIKEDTTLDDLKNLSARLQERFGIQIFQIAMHKDEGYINGKEKKLNLHAHLVADWTDHNTGKSLKLDRKDMAEMQTITAEVLQMDRGVSSEKQHLSAIQYKVQAEEQREALIRENISKGQERIKLINDTIEGQERIEGEKKDRIEYLSLKQEDTEISLSTAQNELRAINSTIEERKAVREQINSQIQDNSAKLRKQNEEYNKKAYLVRELNESIEIAKKFDHRISKAYQSIEDSLWGISRYKAVEEECDKFKTEVKNKYLGISNLVNQAIACTANCIRNKARRAFTDQEVSIIDAALGNQRREERACYILEEAEAAAGETTGYYAGCAIWKRDLESIARGESVRTELERGRGMGY